MPHQQSKHDPSPPSDKQGILIIDDEPAVLKMLALICTRYGYQVDTAESGEAALKKLEACEYRLVLTDIRMPGISGNQILEYVKTGIGSETPVIGMSGTPWLLEGGFDAVLHKPCNNTEILEVIKRLMMQTEPDDALQCVHYTGNARK